MIHLLTGVLLPLLSAASLDVPASVTVGPDDNYQLSIREDLMVFSQRQNLVSQLFSMKPSHLQAVPLLTGNGAEEGGKEAKDPALGPDGQNVAYTDYSSESLGVVCVRNLKSNQSRCFGHGNFENYHPFWMDKQHVGFVRRSLSDSSVSLVKVNLDDGKLVPVLSGNVWSPTFGDGKLYLVGRLGKKATSIWQIDLKNGRRLRVRMDLPGLSATPSLSPDGRDLYFSHYLSDTNNDGVIDASDNGVVMKVPVANLEQSLIVPKQLTSSEMNCSRPVPAPDKLYVTCAFEGSVNIYWLPPSGQIPATWGKAELLDAHKSARSYSERILLLSRLRDMKRGKLYRALLSNYILADDLTAALFYCERLSKLDRSRQNFYHNLLQYLKGRRARLLLPNNEVTARFRREIKSYLSELRPSPFSTLIEAYFYELIGDSRQRRLLRKVSATDLKDPLSNYIYFQLSLQLEPARSKSILLAASNTEQFDLSTQLYYASWLLKEIEKESKTLESQRRAVLAMQKKLKREETQTLFQIEAGVLQLIPLAREDLGKNIAQVNQLVAKIRNNYFLRRAAFTRALELSIKEDADALSAVFARNWLTYTKKSSSEYRYARDIFSLNVLDRTYLHWSNGDKQRASNGFYQSASMTDGLESHYGYIRSMMELGQETRARKIYENWQKRKSSQNIEYANTVFELFQGNATKFDAQGQRASLRWLLKGSLQLKKFLSTAKGYQWDKSLLDETHRSLSYALDTERDNKRIRAAVLMNLAILHARAQNHGYAIRYFERRKPLGFENESQQIDFLWLYARSLFFGNLPLEAKKQLEIAFRIKSSPALLERLAFYSMHAEEYEDAIKYYMQLESQHKLTTHNLATTHLAIGFCLHKSDKPSQATSHLLESLKFSSQLTNKDRGVIEFRPSRLRLITFGLLAKIDKKPEYLLKRIRLLESIGENLEKQVMTQADWYTYRLKAHLEVAQRYWQLHKDELAIEHENKAIELALTAAEYFQQFHAMPVFKTLTTLQTSVLLHKHQKRLPRLSQLSEQAIAGLKKVKSKSPMNRYQLAKLEILNLALRDLPGHQFLTAPPGEEKEYEESKQLLKKKWANLERLTRALAGAAK